MGIDARIEFRPTTRLTEKERKHLAARLNEAMGSVDYCFYEDVDGAAPTYSLINPWRYYGPGYERGPWPVIRAALVWLMRNTDGPVMYGGDSDDVLTHFGYHELDEMDAHWAKVGHRPYYGPSHGDPVVECEDCGINMNAHSYHGNKVDLTCAGCGKKATVTR